MNAPVAPVTGATPAAITPPARRLSNGVMGCYGFGAAAYGVKDAGFGTFLLLFYNQVVGVPAATVGFVVMIALIVDAFVDPTVGFLSDRTRSRWGGGTRGFMARCCRSCSAGSPCGIRRSARAKR